MNFCKCILLAPFEFMREDWTSKCVGVMMLCFYLMLLSVVACGVYWGLENIFIDNKTTDGIVIGKSFVPAHKTSSMIFIGKMMVPNVINHPNSWVVEVRVSNKTDFVGVDENFYKSVLNGQMVHVTYKTGRVSGRLKVVGVQK